MTKCHAADASNATSPCPARYPAPDAASSTAAKPAARRPTGNAADAHQEPPAPSAAGNARPARSTTKRTPEPKFETTDGAKPLDDTQLGLHFVEDAAPDVADAMWKLYETYDAELLLTQQFEVKQDAIARNPLNVPVPGGGLAQATVHLGPLRFAIIDSAARADVYQAEYEITILRDHMGNYQNGQPQTLNQRWVEEV